MRGEHEAALHDLGHHFGRTGLFEAVDIDIVERAHDHCHARADLAHHPEDPQRRSGIGIRHDHGLGAHQAGRHQHLTPGRVAEHHLLAGDRRLLDPDRIDIERDERNRFGLEDAREILAATPVPADDHVVGGAHRLDRDVVQRHGAPHPFGAHQLAHHTLRLLHQQRRQQHRQHQGR